MRYVRRRWGLGDPPKRAGIRVHFSLFDLSSFVGDLITSQLPAFLRLELRFESNQTSVVTMATETVPIPEPAGLPLLGNIGAIDPEFPLGDMVSMAEEHG